MNGLTPEQVDLARWLLAREIGHASEPEALPDAAERACHKLFQRLARLVTMSGCQALLARALHLAQTEYLFLDGVRAGTIEDTCLDGLRETAAGLEPSSLRAALTAVLAGVIGLLATFIGDELALRLVHDVWPDAPFGANPQHMEESQT